MIHTTSTTPREIIQRAFGAVGKTFPLLPLSDKVAEVATIVEILGYGDKVRTLSIKNQIIRTGRA